MEISDDPRRQSFIILVPAIFLRIKYSLSLDDPPKVARLQAA